MAAVERVFQQHQQFRSCVPITLPVLEHPHVSHSAMNPTITERPASALARGIKITEFKETKVNPEPISLEESELILEEYLSPSKLRDLAGVDDLDDVRYLEMKVDTRDTSLGNFGVHLPNLRQLKLSSSIITSVRDLGSSLHNLRVLWMARCGLEDLDGLSSMNSLDELYLAYNDIYDISACSLLEHLQILDLEGNNIDEMSQINFLSTCSKLRSLTLDGNPVCVTPSPDATSDDYDYREAIKEAIPHLELLDDEPLNVSERQSHQRVSVFDDDWALIDELMQEGTVGGYDDDIDSSGLTPESLPISPLRPTTGYRPGSALKNYAGTGIRPGTRSGRPGTQSGRSGTQSVRPATSFRSLPGRPGSARPSSSRSGGRPDSSGQTNSGDDIDNIDDSSDLTRGGVVCGNPSRALKARHKPQKLQSQSINRLMQQLDYKPQPTEEISLEDEDDIKDLLNDIREWKQLHSKKQQEIESRKAPQVLRIDHDDAVSLSDDEESLDSDSGEDRRALTKYKSLHQQLSTRMNGFGGNGVTEGDSDRKPLDVRPKSRTREPLTMSRLTKLRYDESFESTDDAQSEERQQTSAHRSSFAKYPGQTKLWSPSPPPQRTNEPSQLLSNPKSPSATNRHLDRTNAQTNDGTHPEIRPLIHSPEGRQPEGLRREAVHGQSTAASQAPARIRRGLHNVQLLPSKFNK
ncbi:hypothetical protein LSH36_50g04049 [Paralvinella palmiformis]|uniref:Leucine-rich repeat-containing protein 56 n=1 Tax=Paralvinella palmiformis TaxID=53620 RepID=A0AAD9NCN7_9ANNE|nr:hypothetical protein LSH36_50g04049 [Paralvinella palmiformis]